LAVTQTDACGNLLRTFRADFAVEGKTTEQRADALSLAIDKALAYALKHKLPVAMEDLDFSAKKESMARMSIQRRVKLSGLMYAAYQKFMTSKCARQGIELHRVNPAYTSVIGKIKYATAKGWSVHAAAAGVIARRAQGFVEKAPASVKVALGPVVKTLSIPARNAKEGRRAGRWAEYKKCLRETLFKEVRLQSKADRLRFKNRQHCSP
jgi:IS605 OrfB family transposase